MEHESVTTRWNEGGIRCNATIVGGERREPAEVYIQTWSTRQRTMRALKSLGIWWGLAFLSVFIPILHFFLVPLFLLIGLIVPFFAFNKTREVLGGHGTCPFCSKPFEIVEAADVWPLHDVCEACKRHVQIIKDEETPKKKESF